MNKILISHRGNLNGKIIDMENKPEYILDSLDKGYNCEIDIWVNNDIIYLGHDLPQYEISIDFLKNPKLWIHCKNLEALELLTNNKDKVSRFFWHQNDDFTLTSDGYIWTYPSKRLSKYSICVLPELDNYKIDECYGICSDYISTFC